jgi:secreted trypsin-like serine protease
MFSTKVLSLLFVVGRVMGEEEGELQARIKYAQSSNPTDSGVVQLVRAGSASQICTGTMISNRVVLTAGHCFSGKQDLQNMKVQVHEQGGRRLYDLHEIHRHEHYNDALKTTGRMENDIAFVVLRDAPNTAKVKLNLFDSLPDSPGFQVHACGFGVDEKGHVGEYKCKSSSIMNAIGCKDALERELRTRISSPLDDNVLCSVNDFGATCNGDSGGPVFSSPHNREMLQIGVLSHGPSTCMSVSIYTRVRDYGKWIQTKICKVEGQQNPFCRLYSRNNLASNQRRNPDHNPNSQIGEAHRLSLFQPFLLLAAYISFWRG